MEENQSPGRHLQTAASAANAVRGAVKTGKAAANMAKGAAAGPYGAAAAGLWANRGILVKLVAAAVFLLLLPVLFITMLPSLIFGGTGLDSAPDHVLNDNTVLMANLAAAETTIEEGLREKHRLILEKIKQEGDALGSNCDYTITDDFADSIVYESTLLISQFCASQADYKEVRLEKLKQLIDGAAGLFSYHVNITSEEVTDPDTNTTETIYHYAYYVDYAGDVYFADHIFQLTDEQKVLADDYASNLNVFLYDTAFKVDINPNLRPGETGNAAVDLALTKLNTPYSQARRNQDGYFDCSSFCYWVYSQLGVTLSYEGSNTAAAYLPIEKVANGIVYTKDHRYVKIIEVVPINFLLRSAREQRNIIYSFVSYLKISPVKLQFKVLTRRADINRHLEAVREEMKSETDERCIALQKDYEKLIKQIGSKEAITRRFFIIFQYEPFTGSNRHNEELDAINALTRQSRPPAPTFNSAEMRLYSLTVRTNWLRKCCTAY